MRAGTIYRITLRYDDEEKRKRRSLGVQADCFSLLLFLFRPKSWWCCTYQPCHSPLSRHNTSLHVFSDVTSGPGLQCPVSSSGKPAKTQHDSDAVRTWDSFDHKNPLGLLSKALAVHAIIGTHGKLGESMSLFCCLSQSDRELTRAYRDQRRNARHRLFCKLATAQSPELGAQTPRHLLHS